MREPDRGRLPLVAVLLGTDHHPFDRLVRWSSELASVGTRRFFVQHGSTSLPGLLPSGVEGSPMLGTDELASLLSRADAVVTHGGPGLVMEARQAGLHPIVVPRDPALGEHVDGHQLRFARVLARSGLAEVTDSQLGFERAVEAALVAGRGPTRHAPPSGVCDRFGDLAASVIRAPRSRMPVR